ncbi:MAG TPA: prolipoprotein diacylglyceryl transferase family protein [Segetibacter sp.]|nr:prolipoprotein diacylglyceryl transferase family protein [Segetibacter sp.]
MYPNLYYAFKDLFGIELKGLKLVNSFGFFVALAFFAAAWILTLELKRKSREWLLNYKEEKIIVGKPASVGAILINFILGFLIGYKLIGAFIGGDEIVDTQSYILSNKGNLPAGLIVGLLSAGLKWYEKNKVKLAKPKERIVHVWPYDRVGDIFIYAALFGVAGAKIFHNLENLEKFAKDPIGSVFSFNGLSIYGGLICAAIPIWFYCKRNNMNPIYMADAIAPALMLGYGIGRIGCQVAGDGDWGIVSSLPKPFAWLPDWAWSYTYPHNVIGEGVRISGCAGPYCAQLPQGVYPTPLYEAVAAILCFFILWSIRKRITIPGVLAAGYLLLNGIERFLVEQIRVNPKYTIFGFHPTQAELIAGGMMLTGIIMLVVLKKGGQKPMQRSKIPLS